MTKKQEKAQKQIADILVKINDLLEEATEIADDNRVDFDFMPTTVGHYTAAHPEWEASSGCEWETSDGDIIGGEWSSVDWNSSSLSC